jgi:hypothetical protein
MSLPTLLQITKSTPDSETQLITSEKYHHGENEILKMGKEVLLFNIDILLDSPNLPLKPLEFLLHLNGDIHNSANININANLHTISV